ncbi:MAG: 30S ribosomal protein S6 [Pedosphaera sp.]|nr:30S ribosomal protein S6 [Pedosphaera sp.]
MKRYEGLFILDLAGKEDGIKEVVDRVSADIVSVGGAVEEVQKLERKTFARESASGHDAGHYVNIIFTAKGEALNSLLGRFKLVGDIIRVLFTEAPKVVVKP